MLKKLTKGQVENRLSIVRDKTLSVEVRKAAYKEIWFSRMNPKEPEEFNPSTFDPMDTVDDYEIKKRQRKEPPARLPTHGMLPKEIFEGQMIGMYESKQDLYLIMAHYINDLRDRVEQLEELAGIKNKL